jgi:hypothetical protein
VPFLRNPGIIQWMRARPFTQLQAQATSLVGRAVPVFFPLLFDTTLLGVIHIIHSWASLEYCVSSALVWHDFFFSTSLLSSLLSLCLTLLSTRVLSLDLSRTPTFVYCSSFTLSCSTHFTPYIHTHSLSLPPPSLFPLLLLLLLLLLYRYQCVAHRRWRRLPTTRWAEVKTQ